MGYYMFVTSICVAALYHNYSRWITWISFWNSLQQIFTTCKSFFWL